MPINKIQKRIERRSALTHPYLKEAGRIIAVLFGALLVAVGLEFFLVPNGFLDGGITGVSILIANLTGLPLGLFLAVLNIPFVILSWKFLDYKAAIRTIIGIAALSVMTLAFHGQEAWADEYTLTLGYGGALLGLGVGIALRFGGALDGIESLAHIIHNKTGVSMETIIILFNLILFTVAAFIVTPEAALGSFLLFYVVVGPILSRITSEPTAKEARIVTADFDGTTKELMALFKREIGIRKIQKMSADGIIVDLTELSILIRPVEESDLVSLVRELDPESVIRIYEIEEH